MSRFVNVVEPEKKWQVFIDSFYGTIIPTISHDYSILQGITEPFITSINCEQPNQDLSLRLSSYDCQHINLIQKLSLMVYNCNKLMINCCKTMSNVTTHLFHF